MRLKPLAISLLCALSTVLVQAGDLSPEAAAKFLKVIANASSQGKVACAGDKDMKAALESAGVTVDNGSMVAWCASLPDAKMARERGKLVIVGRQELASVACILIQEEGGRPKLVMISGNIHKSKVVLTDAVLKIGEMK